MRDVGGDHHDIVRRVKDVKTIIPKTLFSLRSPPLLKGRWLGGAITLPTARKCSCETKVDATSTHSMSSFPKHLSRDTPWD